METLFTYFIKVSVLVSLFYVAYWLLLKKETFFAKNRLFLLFGLVTALVLPLISITKTIWIEPEPIVHQEPIFIPFDEFDSEITHNIVTEEAKPEINWSYIVAGFYLLGVLFFLSKFVLSSLSLYKILHKTPIYKQNGYKFIDSKSVKTPFSFFNYIAFDSSSFSEEELQNIITHEKVHSNQKHSVDVLLSELILILFWLNPFVWLYRKAMLQNLEFIADSKAITSINRVNYQKTLLKITLNPEKLILTNPFYQPLIKKRIIMINKNKSRKINAMKYTLILPILALFVMQFQTKVVAQEKTKESISKEKQPDLIVADTVIWVKDFSKEYNDEMTSQSTGEKTIIKGGSWKDVKEHLKPQSENKILGKNPLYIINGKEMYENDFKNLTIETLEFDGGVRITQYSKEEAVKKFGEKAKDGAVVIEGEITNLKMKTSSKSNNQEDEVNSLEFQKKIKEIERRAKEIEAEANSPEFQKKIKEIERKAKEIEDEANSPEFQKKIKEIERKAKEIEDEVNSPEFQEKINEIERRAKEVEDKVNKTTNKWEISSYEISTRNNTNTSITINKNTSDKQIQEHIAFFKSQNIDLKVSNIKRNKNGEIIKIKISLSESSGTSNNKKEAKAEATFEREDYTIPNIVVGKRNGSLIVSSDIK